MNQFTHYPHLFEPIRIGGVVAKNRIEIPPMGPRLAAPSVKVGANEVAYFDERAKMGAGIVTIPDTAIDIATAPTFASNYMIDGLNSAAELAQLTKAIHRHGALASIELTHAGGNANAIKGTPLSVSGTDSSHGDFAEFAGAAKGRAMTVEDIQYLIGAYAQAAVLCKGAGFDMVMIHCAHGTLPHQFLSPITNHRTDSYGGSLEGRAKFFIEMLAAIKGACGKDFPVEVRVSASDRVPGGYVVDDLITVLKAAEPYIDLVHVSGGGLIPDAPAFSPYYVGQKKIALEATAKIKATINTPVCAMGGYMLLEDGEKVLSEGKADIIAFGKASMGRRYAFKKAAMGATDEDIVPCVRCCRCVTNVCTLQAVGCTVNPRLGNEFAYPDERKVENPKKVVIVGGGPAGLQAAITATQKGHNVVLFEKSGELGGRLDVVSAQSFKSEYKMYRTWLIKEAKGCGADIRLNTAATRELIEAETPDVLIIAVGGLTIAPSALPADGKKTVMVEDVDLHRVETGDKVIIAGGGISGVESAMDLADAGKDVTIIDLLPELLWAGGAPKYPLIYDLRMQLLREKNVKLMAETRLVKVSDRGVIVADKDGNERELEADTLVLALGVKSNTALVDALSNIVPETYVIGDARQVGDVYSATHDAYYCVMDM